MKWYTEIKEPGNPEEFYKAIIGSNNQDYYLSHFSRFDGNGKGKSGSQWHWPAFFVTFCWLLYRKMWLNAFIYLFVPFFLLFLAGVITNPTPGEPQILLFVIVSSFSLAWFFLLPPMFANTLYYRHCKKKITEASASMKDLQSQLIELSEKGGTSNAVLTIICILICISVIRVFVSIAIPAYPDYAMRTRLIEAVTVEKNVAETAKMTK